MKRYDCMIHESILTRRDVEEAKVTQWLTDRLLECYERQHAMPSDDYDDIEPFVRGMQK